MNAVEALFEENKVTFDEHETYDNAHGRKERRVCKSTSEIERIKSSYPGWDNLRSVCMVESTRETKAGVENKIKYYISSEDVNAKTHLEYSRNHWAIENNLHWTLDVVFKEDQSFFRKNNAAENMSAIRKMVLNVVKKYKKERNSKYGISNLRHLAAWDRSLKTLRDMIGFLSASYS